MARPRSRPPATATPRQATHQSAEPAMEEPSPPTQEQLHSSGELLRLALDQIDVPRMRLRRDLGAVDDLAYSLGSVGILQPIQVFRTGKRYRLIAGERRLQAARLLGWPAIDALVRAPRGDELLLELVENAQRKFL